MFMKESASVFCQLLCQQSLSSCACNTASISYIHCALINPSQQRVIQQGSPQILLNLERAEGMKWREWQFTHPCQYKNIADRQALTEGRREPKEEVTVKSFEMSVRGANGKLNYRSGLVY